MRKLLALAALLISSFFVPAYAFADTAVTGVISSDTIWTKANGPYIVTGTLSVMPGVTLSVEPGTIVKLSDAWVDIYGTLLAGNNLSKEETYFTSFKDDNVGGDTNLDGTSTSAAIVDWKTLYFHPGAVGVFHFTTIAYSGGSDGGSGKSAIVNQHGDVSLYNSLITRSLQNGIYQSTGTSTLIRSEITFVEVGINNQNPTGVITMHQSSIHDTYVFGLVSGSPATIDVTNNWWGSASGPKNTLHNATGTGDKIEDIYDNARFIPWLTSAPDLTATTTELVTPADPCVGVTNCNSNVLFLPGVAGSRLYETSEIESQRCSTDVGNSYFKRWLPAFDCDNTKLLLNSLGMSLNHIVTKDVTDVAAGVSNIYASFLSDLIKWKNDDKIISDYSVVPYDWRLSIDDILNKGELNTDGYIDYTQNLAPRETPYIMSELLRMASSSRTHKVTIVAHSNGGLVTKALMLQLRALGKEDLVDKIIFVAVPQIGTPGAVATLLHGSNVGQLGFISDKRQTREISQNMPAAYNLLPSNKYYQTPALSIPIATFDDSGLYANERSNYGLVVGNFTELTQYLLGTEGRSTPYYSDLNSAAKANGFLLAAATSLHASLDEWVPASTTKVIEVAGVGEYTIAGLQYASETYCEKSHDETLFLVTKRVCDQYTQKKVINDVRTVNGDETVISDSAHYLSDKDTTNVEKWWVDLAKYNSIFSLNISRVHKDIFEISFIRDFVKNQITNSTSTLAYISLVKPTINKAAIKYDLYSPLALNLFDDQGRHTGISTTTGLIEEKIPGTRYIEIGDTKEIIADAQIAQNLLLKGYASGSFSLDIQKLEGDTVTASTTFSAIPSSTSTVVTIDFPANADFSLIGTSSPLKIDFNGDGVVDAKLLAKPNQEAIYDVTPPDVELSFDLSKQSFRVTGNDMLSSTTLATTST